MNKLTNNNLIKELSVALVYDKVNTPYGGAEHVLTTLQQIFPQAPLYTSVYDRKKAAWADNFKVKTSFLQKIPFLRRHHWLIAPLMPLAFESFDFSDYDLIISVTSAEAKGVLTKPNQLHLCYLLTPPRYLYGQQDRYLDSQWLTRLPGIRVIAKMLLRYQTWWDQAAATRPDKIIAISNLVANRVKKYYHRQVESVIYPPIPAIINNQTRQNSEKRSSTKLKLPNHYYLTVSRLVPYKRIDLAVRAALKRKTPLVVVGVGTEQSKLIKLAGKAAAVRQPDESLEQFFSRANETQAIIFFTNTVSDPQLHQLISQTSALLMPGIEDFGITALQAGLFGKPVVLHQDSGAAELLTNQQAVKTPQENLSSLVSALNKLDKTSFNSQTIKANAQKYQTKSFTMQFSKKVYDLFIKQQNPVNRKDNRESS